MRAISRVRRRKNPRLKDRAPGGAGTEKASGPQRKPLGTLSYSKPPGTEVGTQTLKTRGFRRVGNISPLPSAEG